MAVWMQDCGAVHDVTDAPAEIEVVAPADVRDFVAAHGGRLFVWVSTHSAFLFTPCELEASLEPPRRREELAFRRVAVPGFDLYLEAPRKVWPRTLELALRRRKRVEAYWNGMAWIA